MTQTVGGCHDSRSSLGLRVLRVGFTIEGSGDLRWGLGLRVWGMAKATPVLRNQSAHPDRRQAEKVKEFG